MLVTAIADTSYSLPTHGGMARLSSQSKCISATAVNISSYTMELFRNSSNLKRQRQRQLMVRQITNWLVCRKNENPPLRIHGEYTCSEVSVCCCYYIRCCGRWCNISMHSTITHLQSNFKKLLLVKKTQPSRFLGFYRVSSFFVGFCCQLPDAVK